uniref:Uncharacterized protein n=1 Tax=Astyanax mexicanus TaxID=7994 RepID=A0A3B1KH01_ASTMX
NTTFKICSPSVPHIYIPRLHGEQQGHTFFLTEPITSITHTNIHTYTHIHTLYLQLEKQISCVRVYMRRTHRNGSLTSLYPPMIMCCFRLKGLRGIGKERQHCY